MERSRVVEMELEPQGVEIKREFSNPRRTGIMEKFSYISAPLTRPIRYCSIVDILYEHSVNFPEQEICIDASPEIPRKALAFGELYSKSAKLAKHLIWSGIKYGDHVAITGPNSLEWIIAECAILAAGAVVTALPILSTDPKQLVNLLKETNCKGMIFYAGSDDDSSLFLKAVNLMYEEHEYSHTEIPIVVLLQTYPECKFPDIYEILSREASPARLPNINPDDTAVILTTSGTSGKPKYVEMSHFAMVNASARLPPNFDEDKSKMKVYNDKPFRWIGGSPLDCIMRREPRVFASSRLPPCLVWEIMKKEKCTHAVFSPIFLTDALAKKEELLKTDYRIEVIATGGQLLGNKFKSVPGSLCDKLTVIYGSTEVNLITYSYSSSFGDEIGNVGKPFGGVEIRIADDKERPLILGEIGEVQIRSPLYLTGYYGHPDVNQKCFTSIGRWFRTGDIGMITKNHELIIKGKSKDIIKRGEGKAYTGLIEKTLGNLKGIKEVVVVSVPDDRLYEEICACYVIQDGHLVTNREVVAYSETVFGKGSSSLPGYFLKFDIFPRLQTIKPDRIKIRELAIQRINSSERSGIK